MAKKGDVRRITETLKTFPTSWQEPEEKERKVRVETANKELANLMIELASVVRELLPCCPNCSSDRIQVRDRVEFHREGELVVGGHNRDWTTVEFYCGNCSQTFYNDNMGRISELLWKINRAEEELV